MLLLTAPRGVDQLQVSLSEALALALFAKHLVRHLPNAEEAVVGTPSWSPDGAKIVYYRSTSCFQASIWVSNIDGTGAVQITDSDPERLDAAPAWQPLRERAGC